MISKEKSDSNLKSSYSYIDVRDVATAHVVALNKEEAGGERIITSNGMYTSLWLISEMTRLIHEFYD